MGKARCSSRVRGVWTVGRGSLLSAGLSKVSEITLGNFISLLVLVLVGWLVACLRGGLAYLLLGLLIACCSFSPTRWKRGLCKTC